MSNSAMIKSTLWEKIELWQNIEYSMRLRCVKQNNNFSCKTFSNSSILITLYSLEPN